MCEIRQKYLFMSSLIWSSIWTHVLIWILNNSLIIIDGVSEKGVAVISIKAHKQYIIFISIKVTKIGIEKIYNKTKWNLDRSKPMQPDMYMTSH